MKPVRHGATYDDLLRLPQGLKAEVLGGEVVTHPSPLPEHQYTAGALGDSVGGPFQHGHGRGGPGGWWTLPDVDVRLATHDIVRPDLAGWQRVRLPSPW